MQANPNQQQPPTTNAEGSASQTNATTTKHQVNNRNNNQAKPAAQNNNNANQSNNKQSKAQNQSKGQNNKYKRVGKAAASNNSANTSTAVAGSSTDVHQAPQCAQGAQTNTTNNYQKQHSNRQQSAAQASAASASNDPASKTNEPTPKPVNGPKELTQLEIISGFLNKRLANFKEKCISMKSSDVTGAQHQILRDLMSQVAIVCGVCGPPQTAGFKKNGSIFSIKKLFPGSDMTTSPNEIAAAELLLANTKKQQQPIATLKVTKYTQTPGSGVGMDAPQALAQSPSQQLIPSEESLAKLNKQLAALQEDLQTKVAHSATRTGEKQQLLAIFPQSPAAAQTSVKTVGATAFDNDTRSQITQVIAKEESIQSDLRACIDKLLLVKQKLSDKVHCTVIKKQAELHAITLLVELVSQAH